MLFQESLWEWLIQICQPILMVLHLKPKMIQKNTKEPGLKADYARKMEHPVLNLRQEHFEEVLCEILKKSILSSTENI